MKFQNPSLNSVLNGRTEGRTDERTDEHTSRNQYAPHFFKVGGIMSLVVRKPVFCVSDQSDTNRAVRSQKMARCLKFRIQKVEGSYYLCSEKRGADQLRGYREADLRLCFRICKTLVFS